MNVTIPVLRLGPQQSTKRPADFMKPALCLLAILLPTLSVACQPSKACALERAQQHAIVNLAAMPDAIGASDLGRLIAMLERKAPDGNTSRLIATLLAKASEHGRRDQVLNTISWTIAYELPERALQLAMNIEDTRLRADALASLSGLAAPNSGLDYAASIAASVPAGMARSETAWTLARVLLESGRTQAARAMLQPLLKPEAFAEDIDAAEIRVAILCLLTRAAALEGNDALAWQIAAAMEPAGRSKALLEISRVHAERGARGKALQTLELVRHFSVAVQVVEGFAELGQTQRALAVGAELELNESETTTAIAAGQIRGGDLAGARATLQRLSAAQRRESDLTVELAKALLLADADITATLESVESADHIPRIAVPTAVKLASRGEHARASAILDHAVKRALQRSGCTGDCDMGTTDLNADEPCGTGQRDVDLCNLSTVQSRLGLITQATTTAAHIIDDDRRIQAWRALAEAQAAAGMLSDAGNTFERGLQLAQHEPALPALRRIIAGYAECIRTHPQLHSALPRLQRAALTLPTGLTNDEMGQAALRALATAQASAGNFSAAFELAARSTDATRIYFEIFEFAR